jgi:hypothetical protein
MSKAEPILVVAKVTHIYPNKKRDLKPCRIDLRPLGTVKLDRKKP